MDSTRNHSSGELYVCTWCFAESEEHESTYFQVPGRSSSPQFQATYWRCVALFFATSWRHQQNVRHVLFTNVDQIPSVDGVDVLSLLKQWNVEIIVLPYTFTPPPGFYTAYQNQFYLFDIAHYLNRIGNADDSFLVFDSDCVWVSNVEPMRYALARDGVLTYVVNLPTDWPNNGLTREEMRTIASEILADEVPSPLIYCGGELLAATAPELSRLTTEIDTTWHQLLARHARNQPTFNEEGHTLSYIYYKLGYPLGNGDPFIRRIATGAWGIYNNALPTDHGLVVWHVPLEKRLGLRRLFPLVADQTSEFWSAPVGASLRHLLGAYLGVHRNPAEKRMRDLARRIGDKVRYR